MPVEQKSWTPDPNLFPRAVNAFKSLIRTPFISSRSYFSVAMWATTGSLMCEANLCYLDRAQRQVIADFANLSFYADNIQDNLLNREHRGIKGIRQIRNFWRIPQRIDEFSQRAREAGYSDQILKPVLGWFDWDLVINLQMTTKQRLNPAEVSSLSDSEKRIWGLIREKLQSVKPEDEPILLRTLSCRAFASALLSLTENQPEIDPRKLERATALILILQIIDDFATAREDQECGIEGVIAKILPTESSRKISLEDTQKAVSLAKGLIAGSLDQVRIDPKRKWKKAFFSWGTLAAAAIAGKRMSATHGGYSYSTLDLLRSIYQELKSPTSQTNPARIATQRALTAGMELNQNFVSALSMAS